MPRQACLVCCRSQLKKRDEDFAGLQSMHDAVKGQLEHQTEDLSAKLAKVSCPEPACWHASLHAASNGVDHNG